MHLVENCPLSEFQGDEMEAWDRRACLCLPVVAAKEVHGQSQSGPVFPKMRMHYHILENAAPLMRLFRKYTPARSNLLLLLPQDTNTCKIAFCSSLPSGYIWEAYLRASTPITNSRVSVLVQVYTCRLLAAPV